MEFVLIPISLISLYICRNLNSKLSANKAESKQIGDIIIMLVLFITSILGIPLFVFQFLSRFDVSNATLAWSTIISFFVFFVLATNYTSKKNN